MKLTIEFLQQRTGDVAVGILMEGGTWTSRERKIAEAVCLLVRKEMPRLVAETGGLGVDMLPGRPGNVANQ